MTVTPVDTVQYCSPCPLDPEPSPDVCVKLENNEGKMDQSEASSNIIGWYGSLKCPDSSVPRTRGYGRQDEPPPTVS